jgi:hypothetical protein
MLAARRGHKDVIKSLLEKKANPNITDKVGLSVWATCIIVWIISFAAHCSRMWKEHIPYVRVASARVSFRIFVGANAIIVELSGGGENTLSVFFISKLFVNLGGSERMLP